MTVELLAVTPAGGQPDLDLLARWRDAGALERRFAVLLRSPGCSARQLIEAPRLCALREACAAFEIPVLLALDATATATATATAPAVATGTASHVELGYWREHGIAGVQLRGDPTPARTAAVRERLGDRYTLGGSVHGAPPPACDDALDYVCFAPVFAPHTIDPRRTKHPAGLGALRRWAGTARTWVVALGGVTATTARPCVDAGASGLASISTFFGPGPEVAEHLPALVEALCSRDVPPT